tara:strand:+ start:673 stop:978 length:306 start_codon:yes stop_codon:yes gene_type:complete
MFGAFTTIGGYGFVAMRTRKRIDTTTQALREMIMQSDVLTHSCWAVYFALVVTVLLVLQVLLDRERSPKLGHASEIVVGLVIVVGVFASEPIVGAMRTALA